MSDTDLVYDAAQQLDPLGDADKASADGTKKNFAKVGTARPSSLLYTYGPGAIMDLPNFTVMPSGLDDWEPIWKRRDGIPLIKAPRLLEAVRVMLGPQVDELRPFPWNPNTNSYSRDGNDLGVPARVFPQWLRCTGCDRLAPIPVFEYRNTNPYRSDRAIFEHTNCRGRPRRAGESPRPTSKKDLTQPAVAARYLLTCPDGHLDEFPYIAWVHHGIPCPQAPDAPVLRLVDGTASKGATATVHCDSCGARRGMNEAQGAAGRAKLPRCRGRLPHLDGFEQEGCDREPHLMLVGASNLWFPAVQSIIVMPRLDAAARDRDHADTIRVILGERLAQFAGQIPVLRALLETDGRFDARALSDTELASLCNTALNPPHAAQTEEERAELQRTWDPIKLLAPEWEYLLRDPLGQRDPDLDSGLMLSPRDVHPDLRPRVDRVLAVDRLRKVNAVLGFTRVDAFDRVNDLDQRLVRLTRTKKPAWTVATEDRGEGVFMQLQESAVAAWEKRVLDSSIWEAHQASHRRNFERRFSETAKTINPDDRLQPPRYWLLHTLAHCLIREMAMYSGYGAASLSERIYAWDAEGDRPASAGLLICTTASDSDGTLGGLVRLSEPERLAAIIRSALRRAGRCSSDPVCAMRTPRDPEDFLHGAACHCCVMASETSCERANRFLDRRFLVSLPLSDLGFFGDPHDW
ncbi:MAG: DUF1998 domain-containing protein [Dermatophilus congolensis]|nr:DUF1998 domain-containing protein [Dermatophilus congolensis]